MSKLRSPLTLFFITVIVIALLALFGPEEKSLGSNVRIVYLHGAWVLTAEIAFIAAGIAGLIALITEARTISSMVRRARTNGYFLLGNLSSTFALGDGIQLERALPIRASLSPGSDLCCNRSLVAGGTLAHQHKLDHIRCEHNFYHCVASDISTARILCIRLRRRSSIQATM